METLAGMRLFNKVAETGSFSEAGRQLGLAPSSVSRQVNALEEALGTRLLNRTTRALHLTEAGDIYYERTHRILAEIEEANLAVSSLQQEPRGVLRLNIPVVFGRRYIAPMLPEFLDRYPDVQVDLQVTDNYVDLVEEGMDLAIRVGGLTGASLIARKLISIHRVLVASRDYLDRHGAPQTPDDLTRHNCLRFRVQPGESVWELERDGKSVQVRVTGNILSNNAEAIAAAMRNGAGIALLPIWVVGREIQRGDAVIVLSDYRPRPSDLDAAVSAVYPYNRNVSAKVRAYVDFLVEKFRDEPDFKM